MFRTLKESKLVETADHLYQRISDKFPDSGLSHVAAEVAQVTKEAVVRAESIRRPNLWLRGSLIVLALTVVGVIIQQVLTREVGMTVVNEIVQFLGKTAGVGIYVVAIAIFLVTLETRLKRARAVDAVHELRAMAHIIDMHQLTKDPDRLNAGEEPLVVSGRPLNLNSMRRYLHYCTELLALVSKIGQLYVQDFPDTTALASVDQFENLATGLSSKIWQKIMILDRMRADAEEEAVCRTTLSVPVAAAAVPVVKEAEPTSP